VAEKVAGSEKKGWKNMQEKIFNNGEVMIRQGESDPFFYQIISGSADVFVGDDSENKTHLATLKEGAYFGEMSLLEGGIPHSATVVAAEDNTRVLEIPADQISEYYKTRPDKIYDLMKYIGTRIRSMTDTYKEALEDLEKAKGEGREALGGRLSTYIANRRNLKKLSQVSVDVMQSGAHKDGFAKKVNEYEAGKVICREGATGDCMYDIHWGSVGVYTGYGTDKEKKIADLYTNAFFGEMGMLDGAPRSATVVALEDTTIETITAKDLDELFEKNPAKVWMITDHLSRRLRNLTRDYLKVCDQIAEVCGE
jgi:CRP-like cAMP-binding protein